MASSQRILCIPQAHHDGSHILVNVTPNGHSPLDLKLVATESENVYIGFVKQSRLNKLQATNYRDEKGEWSKILSVVLLQEEMSGEDTTAVQGLETTGAIEDGRLTITLRKNIGGITQKLGGIELLQNDDEEIQLYEWNAVTAQQLSTQREVSSSLQARYKELEEKNKKLEGQLEELIRGSQEHESILLEKFRELLNSKKSKIRDQQRLLSGSRVDPEKAAGVRNSRAASRSSKPLPSRGRKRKPDGASPSVTSSESDGEGFEKMENKEGREKGREEDELVSAETPSNSDLDETEDEDAASGDDGPTSPRASKSGGGRKGEIIEPEAQKETNTSHNDVSTPPPRRELPFSKIGQVGRGKASEELAKRSPVSEGTNEGSGPGTDETEGETDDDEL
ncbi:MAG: hypothetical protein M1819_001537 [Sarea resinae]|nr:MAG: hypothetical protein M1819_001537 [Sarea resinae]